jgi:hypothetical protein
MELALFGIEEQSRLSEAIQYLQIDLHMFLQIRVVGPCVVQIILHTL